MTNDIRAHESDSTPVRSENVSIRLAGREMVLVVRGYYREKVWDVISWLTDTLPGDPRMSQSRERRLMDGNWTVAWACTWETVALAEKGFAHIEQAVTNERSRTV